MKLEIGSEKRFFEFISKLGEKKEKIALINHTDLDGIVSAKVTNKVIDANLLKFVNYTDLNNELIKELKKEKVNKIIFTDLLIKDEKVIKELEKFAHILILDHHISKDWNSEKTVFIRGETGYSCGYLCYELFSKIQNLSKLDWLVACSCISDYCHIKPEAWLRNIFEKYGDKLEYVSNYVRKSGKFWDLQLKISLSIIYFSYDLKRVYESIGEEFAHIADLEKYAKEVQDEISKAIERFSREKRDFEEGYYWEFAPKFHMGSIVSNILSEEENSKIYVIVRQFENNKYCYVSIRRQDGKKNMNEFLSRLLRDLKDAEGGGHKEGAGGHFLKKDLAEFKRRLGLKEKT